MIAAYLTFFPVAINTLRGLLSTDRRAVELMRAFAASRWQDPLEAARPGALPYIFSAFKVSATACVVGAIIGEAPSSIQDGLGGYIVNFNQYYTTEPAEPLGDEPRSRRCSGILFFLVSWSPRSSSCGALRSTSHERRLNSSRSRS